jgi:hypothetical protein
MLSKIWSVLEKNRWTVLAPIAGIMLWFYASIACTPQTSSPIRPTVQVNIAELQQDFETWQAESTLMTKKFEWAVTDIKQQEERWNNIESALMSVATGGVTSWSGLLSILTGSGLIGLFADNIRKNGVIGGLKRNKATT